VKPGETLTAGVRHGAAGIQPVRRDPMTERASAFPPVDEAGVPLTWPYPRTFFGVPRCDRLSELDARVAFLGVPYDAGTRIPILRTGQSRGPSFARMGSTQWNYTVPGYLPPGPGAAGWYDIEDERECFKGVTMADCGDVAIVGALPIEENIQRITHASRYIAERGSMVVAVGGDHSISFPVGRGMEPHGLFDVVHFDAHPDFADDYEGARYSHGSNLRRLSELPFVDHISAIGLRHVVKQHHDDLKEYGASVVTSRQLIEEGAGAVERAVREAENLYVSIDLDVLDLPYVGGACLPEVGGIGYRTLREALLVVARKGNVVGFDVVELAPPYDLDGATARVTTWIITHFLAAIFDQAS
jgi:agmatinase